jgi:hypothetical protein
MPSAHRLCYARAVLSGRTVTCRTSGRTLGLVVIASVVYYVLVVLEMYPLQLELDPLNRANERIRSGAYGFLMTTTFFVLCAGVLATGFGFFLIAGEMKIGVGCR